MYIETQDGEELTLNAVVLVSNMQGTEDREFYNVYLNGGQHVTIKESYKPRADFIAEWKLT